MEDRREAKRARQACLNCRRKKTRCSGEKPVCAFCARLNQRCTWGQGNDDASEVEVPRAGASSSSASHEINLAARVALLESRLSFLNADTPFSLFTSLSAPGLQPPSETSRHEEQDQDAQTISGAALVAEGQTKDDFSSLPAEPIVRSLIETYFERCHNQPYAYFHEAMFRRDFEAEVLPDYLLYAVAATACRFSDHEFYRGREDEAIQSYARISFRHIFEHSFTYEDSLELSMVKAMAMLAVVDFAGGRPKLGWVKLAISGRFAQALRLNEEPEPQLPAHEQEERRRTFWSLYLLDNLMSLGPNRPPSFLDEDCTVHLPCHEDLFKDGLPGGPVPTLTAVVESPTAYNHSSLDVFALSIMMASALSRFIRFALKRTFNSLHILWDPRSKYHEVHSILLHFESHSPCAFTPVTDTLQQLFTYDGVPDPRRAGHFLFSQALFHLNHCLLNHPFILYRIFHSYTGPVPLSFVQEALERCYKHASDLLDLIRDADNYGPFIHPSFFGYCSMSAGLINRLYEKHEDPTIAQAASDRVKLALEFLERKPPRWGHVTNMGTLLRAFQLDKKVARTLTDPVSLARKAPVPHGSMLWQLLDYAWLPQNRTTPGGTTTQTLADLLPELIQEPSVSSIPESIDMIDSPESSAIQLDDNTGIIPDYARMLGEDMGGILSQALGDDGMQKFPHGRVYD